MQHPHRFHKPGHVFRDHSRDTCDHGTSRRQCICRVRLAVLTSMLAIRSVDLDHHQTLPREEPGETRAIGAGPLDPDSLNITKLRCPPDQTSIARQSRWNLKHADLAPQMIDRDRAMRLGMSIHPHDNLSDV